MNSNPPYQYPSLRRWFVALKAFAEAESIIANIPANQVFATPNGSSGGASFRALVANDISNLDSAKITTGTFDVARIPNLDGSIFTSGVFTTGQIPNLDGNKFGSGTFADARIPNLDASKFTTGVFDNARVNWANPSAIGGTTPEAATFTDLKFQTFQGAVQINNGAGAEVVTNGVTIGVFSTTQVSIELPPASSYFTGFTSSTGLAGMLCIKVRPAGAGSPPTILPASGDDIDGAASLATSLGRSYIFFAVLATRWRLFTRLF